MELICLEEPHDGTVSGASFDYANVSAGVAEQARASAKRIRSHYDEALEARATIRSRAVDIGNELEAAKNLVGQANFAAWVEAELPSWGIRQAENFMRAARVFRTNPQLISHLSDTVVTALAYAPNEVCRDLLRRSEGGTRLTVAMVRKESSAFRALSAPKKRQRLRAIEGQEARETEPERDGAAPQEAAPVAPAILVPQEPAGNPLLAECEELVELRAQIKRLDQENRRLREENERLAGSSWDTAEEDYIRLEQAFKEVSAENAELKAENGELRARLWDLEARPGKGEPKRVTGPAAQPKPADEEAFNPRILLPDGVHYLKRTNLIRFEHHEHEAPFSLVREGKSDENLKRFYYGLKTHDRAEAWDKATKLVDSGAIVPIWEDKNARAAARAAAKAAA
jgi:regulator of replication initiation timing